MKRRRLVRALVVVGELLALSFAYVCCELVKLRLR